MVVVLTAMNSPRGGQISPPSSFVAAFVPRGWSADWLDSVLAVIPGSPQANPESGSLRVIT